jgi:hypothetical protein
MPQGTCLVGDFSKCAIFDRESTDITLDIVQKGECRFRNHL